MSLASLGDQYWDLYLRIFPTDATLIGYRDYDDQLPPPTKEWENGMLRELRSIKKAAERIDAETLDAQDVVTRAILIEESQKLITNLSQRSAEVNVSALLGPHSMLLRAAAQTTVDGADQADRILDRYGKIPAYLGVYAARHREGVKRGRVPAAINIRHVVGQINAYLNTPVQTDPFVSTPALETWEGEADWRVSLFELIEEKVRPAFARYRDAIADEILPHALADDRPGILYLPDGEEWYRELILTYTTLPLSAEEIHQTGLDKLEELRVELGLIGEQALGVSDPAEVMAHLREDPALKFESAEEILSMAEEAIQRAEAAVGDWFNRYPKTHCQVQPVPEALAPSMPPAHYMEGAEDGSRPGTYFVNTHDANKRHRYESEAIAFHEAVPGHHFDRTIAQELDGVPAFRRYALAYAHAEGWGLYAERLADEMGLYSSDVTRLGMVAADLWRAGRLVADTGIHALGWTRQQAIDFFVEHTPISLPVIAQEVDRYIAMPGQALAYMIGRLEIEAQRARAEEALGDRFDIREFHDVILSNGGVPLGLMRELVGTWIEESLAS